MVTISAVLLLGAVSVQAAGDFPVPRGAESKPNIIFVMCDDLGYGQLGCYGQKMIKTPNLDRMAQEGLRLTDYYAGTSVCAPSRCALMTGKHVGHAFIRGNKEYSTGEEPIPDETVTVAEKMKDAGYRTALVGKWGLGYPGSEGDPNRQGFDFFFGYNDQKRAHNYYPGWIWKNDQKVELGAKDTSEGYSHYALTREARRFIQDNQNEPFFLYLAYTIPHAHLEIPADDPCFVQYQNKKWPEKQKIHAGMISRVDTDVGGILDLLRETGLAENTLVVFTSDNGPHREGGAIPGFFNDSGPLRGIKRDMYEGGVRVPFIAHWPGTIKPGQVSDHLAAHWDLMPTACALAGVTAPEDTDGISYVPLLKGNSVDQKQHDSVYFELHWPDRRGMRMGNWVAVQQMVSANPDTDDIELYNLETDLAQKTNLAERYPEKVAEFKEQLATAHAPSDLFKFGNPRPKMQSAPPSVLFGANQIPDIQNEACFESSVMTCDGKTLSVSTGKVRREWSWTSRGWQTVQVSNLGSGTDWPLVSGVESADWDIPETSDDAVLVSVRAQQSDDEGFTAPHLEVISTVQYVKSGLEVQYVIWAYPEAPGLRTQLRLKRTGAYSGSGKGRAGVFEVLTGKPFTPPAANKTVPLPPAFISTLAEPKALKIKLDGLDPTKPAHIGFSWLDWGSGGRVQSVVFSSVDGEAQDVVVDRQRLPGWKKHGEQPAQFVIPVNPTLYPDGTVTMTVKAESVASACLSEVWVYKQGEERDRTEGVPQDRIADILSRAPEGATLVAYMNCGFVEANNDAVAENPGVGDGVPLALSGVDLAAVGYYSNTQHRNHPNTELLKEESLSGAAGESDWASVLTATAGDERLVLVKESHKCVNTPHGGANTGGFVWGDQGVRVTGLGWTMSAVKDDRFYNCWPTWMVLSSGNEDQMALDIKIMDRMRYPIDPKHDMYIMANTWGSSSEKRNAQIAAREDNILAEIESQADLGIDVQQIDDGWQGFDYNDWRPILSNELLPRNEVYSVYQSDTYPVYPEGWKNVREMAASKGMVLGLWAAYQISAADLIWNFENGGFRYFKLDFANLGTMGKYDDLMRRARELILRSQHTARINWDVTEKAPRVGYFSGRECGNIYLENRKPRVPASVVYTPYLVLRDAWHVSRYLNLNKFQLTIQNNARIDQQVSDAYLHPEDYTVAQTLMGSPLFFQETHYYTDAARDLIRPLLAVYKRHRAAMYKGYVFPIGDKPDNKSWSGFQCYIPGENQGYLTIFRPLENPDETHEMSLKFFDAGTRLKLTDLMSGASREVTLGEGGTVEFSIDRAAGFKFLKYDVVVQ